MITTAASRPPDFLKILKEGGIVAGIVFALAFGLVGFRTEDVPGGLDIRYRFDDVFMAAGLAFLGRVGILLLRANRPVPVAAVSGVVAAVMLGILITHGFAPEKDLIRFLPFGDLVVTSGSLPLIRRSK